MALSPASSRGTGGGPQTLEEVLTAGPDGGGVGMTNTGSIDAGNANVSGIDDLTASSATLDGSGGLSVTGGPIANSSDHSDWGGNRIENLGTPNSSDDAATKGYVDGFTPSVTLADVLATSDDANGLNIANLADPSDAQQAATKNYVDGLVATPQTSADVVVTQAGGTIVLDPAATFVRWIQVGKSVTVHFQAVMDAGTTGSSGSTAAVFADLPPAHASYDEPTAAGVAFVASGALFLMIFVKDPVSLSFAPGVLAEGDAVAGTFSYEAA